MRNTQWCIYVGGMYEGMHVHVQYMNQCHYLNLPATCMHMHLYMYVNECVTT